MEAAQAAAKKKSDADSEEIKELKEKLEFQELSIKNGVSLIRLSRSGPC